MTRLSLFLLLGTLIIFSSAVLADHKTQHGGYDSHQGYIYGGTHDRHHKGNHNKHYKRHGRRHHRHNSHCGYHQPQALFSLSYGPHGTVIDYRSYPYSGYLYSNDRRHGR